MSKKNRPPKHVHVNEHEQKAQVARAEAEAARKAWANRRPQSDGLDATIAEINRVAQEKETRNLHAGERARERRERERKLNRARHMDLRSVDPPVRSGTSETTGTKKGNGSGADGSRTDGSNSIDRTMRSLCSEAVSNGDQAVSGSGETSLSARTSGSDMARPDQTKSTSGGAYAHDVLHEDPAGEQSSGTGQQAKHSSSNGPAQSLTPQAILENRIYVTMDELGDWKEAYHAQIRMTSYIYDEESREMALRTVRAAASKIDHSNSKTQFGRSLAKIYVLMSGSGLLQREDIEAIFHLKETGLNMKDAMDGCRQNPREWAIIEEFESRTQDNGSTQIDNTDHRDGIVSVLTKLRNPDEKDQGISTMSRYILDTNTSETALDALRDFARQIRSYESNSTAAQSVAQIYHDVAGHGRLRRADIAMILYLNRFGVALSAKDRCYRDPVEGNLLDRMELGN